jgi:hypothetical protein
MMTEKLSSADGASTSTRKDHAPRTDHEVAQEDEDIKRKREGFVRVDFDGSYMWVKDSEPRERGLAKEESEVEGRELEYDPDELKGDLEV